MTLHYNHRNDRIVSVSTNIDITNGKIVDIYSHLRSIAVLRLLRMNHLSMLSSRYFHYLKMDNSRHVYLIWEINFNIQFLVVIENFDSLICNLFIFIEITFYFILDTSKAYCIIGLHIFKKKDKFFIYIHDKFLSWYWNYRISCFHRNADRWIHNGTKRCA